MILSKNDVYRRVTATHFQLAIISVAKRVSATRRASRRWADLISSLGQRAITPIVLIVVTVVLTACVGIAPGVQPVDEFDAARYLGKWYEIARLDHLFEKGLTHVTAEYSLRDDGGIRVINSGYSRKTGKRKVAEGKAYFVNDESEGYLKVTFFGPFYGSYVVFGLDKINYQYAFVTSYNKNYLWLLSRAPTIEENVQAEFVASARKMGFDIDSLIFVEQK